MRRALYLRPRGIAESHVDQIVKDWLAAQEIEPVEVNHDHGVVSTASHDLLVFLPYDGGGNYYHAEVSPVMARIIVEHIAESVEVRTIHLSQTDVDYRNDSLRSVALEFDTGHYGSKVTLALMTQDDVVRAEREILEDHVLADVELGTSWKPPEPTPASEKRSYTSVLVTLGEVEMMRRVAAADANGTGICAPAKPDRTLEWLSGIGLFHKFDWQGRTAYRLTDRGRALASEEWQEVPTPFIVAGTDIQQITETRKLFMKGSADGDSGMEIGFPSIEGER